MNQGITQILDKLYLGGWREEGDKDDLKSKHISHILSVAIGYEFSNPEVKE